MKEKVSDKSKSSISQKTSTQKSSTAPANFDLKVAMFWGDILYDTAICRPKDAITIGRGEDNTFVLDLQGNEAKDEKFTLVQVHPGHSADLYFDDHYEGHIRVGDKLMSLAAAKGTAAVTRVSDDGPYTVRLSQQDKADVVIGHVSFYLDWVEPAEKIPFAPFFQERDGLIAMALFLLVAAAFLLLQLTQPEVQEKPPEHLVQLEAKHVRATSPTPSKAEPSKAAIGQVKTKDGGAAKGPLGKASLHKSDKQSATSSLRKSNLGSLVGGLTSLGADSPDKKSNNSGESAAISQEGTGGFSTEGLKKGGGGTTTGIGRTVGQGEGGFAGTGRLGLAGNSSVDGTGSGGGGIPTRVAGGLDREVIESIIRRRLDRIRLCYERQLNFFPKLAGKVAVHFLIGKKGEVLEANSIEDTMNNASVKSCILFEVKSWTFPAPEGGTLVNVDYPFVFESSAKAGK
jgi:hypothetical protein